jgi:CO dehydrogenase maturation factor
MFTVAVAGKGGTGKTTFSALLIQLLAARGTVLAIDADPSTNLNMALGVAVDGTVGDAREEMATAVRGGRFGAGVDKRSYLETRIAEALVESKGFDLLAMGRPEGAGCYCAANNMLRASIDRLSKSYDYVVIDNEAGLEHLSRQMTRDVDALFLVTDPSLRGLVAAARARDLARDLKSGIARCGLIVNRLRGDLSTELRAAVSEYGLDLWATIADDPALADLDARGRPVVDLPGDAPTRLAVESTVRMAGIVT